MKKIFITLFTFMILAVSPEVNAQKFSDLDPSPMDVALYRAQDKSPMVRVIYSRPQMKGRDIFGNLVNYDKVWRTGANESTEITLYNDMMVGDKTVKAGTYTLFTIPGKDEWTVILNKDINTWGAYGYKEERDVVRITTPARKAAAPIEAFSISFQPKPNGTDMYLGWDETYIQVPFEEVEM